MPGTLSNDIKLGVYPMYVPHSSLNNLGKFWENQRRMNNFYTSYFVWDKNISDPIREAKVGHDAMFLPTKDW